MFKAFRSFYSNAKIPDNRVGPSTPPQTPAHPHFSQKPKFDLFFEAFPYLVMMSRHTSGVLVQMATVIMCMPWCLLRPCYLRYLRKDLEEVWRQSSGVCRIEHQIGEFSTVIILLCSWFRRQGLWQHSSWGGSLILSKRRGLSSMNQEQTSYQVHQ